VGFSKLQVMQSCATIEIWLKIVDSTEHWVISGKFNAVEICLVNTVSKIRDGLICVIINVLVLLAST